MWILEPWDIVREISAPRHVHAKANTIVDALCAERVHDRDVEILSKCKKESTNDDGRLTEFVDVGSGCKVVILADIVDSVNLHELEKLRDVAHLLGWIFITTKLDPDGRDQPQDRVENKWRREKKCVELITGIGGINEGDHVCSVG